MQNNDDLKQPNPTLDENPAAYDQAKEDTSCPIKKSRFSPAAKGALIGAVAGSVLPVFGTISGAIIGAIGGKVYEKKCLNKPKY
jgi:hypothetical protein